MRPNRFGRISVQTHYNDDKKDEQIGAGPGPEQFLPKHDTMHTSTVLRACIVLEWIILAAGIALSSLLESALPGPLRDWLAAEEQTILTFREIALLVLMVPLLICSLVASIGLLFLKRWAAWLYLISLIFGYLLFPFMGPTVEHGLADAVDEVAVLLSGLIIGLAFFSGALRSKPGDQDLAPMSGPSTALGSSEVSESPPPSANLGR